MSTEQWTQSFQQVWAEYSQSFIAYLPSLITAFVLLLSGWICAKLGRLLTVKLITSLYQLGQRFADRRGIQHSYISHSSPQVIANLIYWLIILLFLVVIAKTLKLDVFSTWLFQLISYFPTLATGLLIIITGIIFGNVLRDLIATTLPPNSIIDRNVLSRTTQIIVFVTAIIIGVDQIGINVNFLIIISSIATGVLLGGLVLAFSLGAQTHVRDIIASKQIQNSYRLGQFIRIQEFEGRIVSILAQAVVLETKDGKVSIPSRLFFDEAVYLGEEEL